MRFLKFLVNIAVADLVLAVLKSQGVVRLRWVTVLNISLVDTIGLFCVASSLALALVLTAYARIGRDEFTSRINRSRTPPADVLQVVYAAAFRGR